MQKPSEIIKEYVEQLMAQNKMESCGNPAIDLLAKHVAKLAAHADAVDKFLDISYEELE